MAFVPLRLRSVVVLAVGGAGAVVISAWGLSHSALTADGSLTPAMDSAGHTFGVVLVIVLVLVTAAGLACAWAMDHRAVSAATRRRAGTALVVLACLIPVAAVGALATSSRGLTGQISHAWDSLTSTHAVVFNNPGRVLQFGSSRPMYWHQGLDVGAHALFKGVGASGYGTARLRYTTNRYVSAQAHSYVIQTFADLGLLGIAITFALLLAWVRAALRPIAPRTRERSLTDDQRDERAGMVALALIVIGFGIESTLDWTWYFPGVSVPVLLCAGWLVGRGPLAAPVGWLRSRRSLLDRPGAVAIAAAVAVIALAGAWMQWLPQRSADEVNASLNADTNAQAFDQARAAVASDPLALQPRFVLASLYQSVNDIPAARAQLQHAVQTQPENPFAWAQLGGWNSRSASRNERSPRFGTYSNSTTPRTPQPGPPTRRSLRRKPRSRKPPRNAVPRSNRGDGLQVEVEQRTRQRPGLLALVDLGEEVVSIRAPTPIAPPEPSAAGAAAAGRLAVRSGSV